MNKPLQSWFLIPVLALLTCFASRADVTARYKTETTTNPAIASLAPGAMKGLDAIVPQELELRLKNGKAVSELNGLTTILDYSSKGMTVIDAASMRYAKTTYQQFLEETAQAMPATSAGAAAALAAMKTSVSDAKLTGRTAVIQGVEAEEREMVMSMEGPSLPDAPVSAGPMLRLVFQIWTAKPDAALRIPAIHELAGYSSYQDATMNPLASLATLLNQMPGVGQGLEAMLKQIHDAGIVLRMHVDLFMPALAAILERVGVNGASALDPAAPMFQINHELVELSTTPVPDSALEVPRGYQEAAASEIIQARLAKTRPAAVK
jgi:hypothetical protein